MNILFINTSRTWGGNEKWTSLAAHHLARKHNVFLAFRSDRLGSRFSINKKQLLFLNRLDIYTLLLLVRYIHKNSISIVVSTNRKYYLLGGLASIITGCRHFVRLGIIWDVPENSYYRLLFSRFVQGIIVNARPIRTRLTQTGFIPERKIHLIYNGLDTDRLDQARTDPADKHFAFTVAASGELTPRKGHKLLIESFARFISRYRATDAGLVIMGSGRQEQELRDLTENLGIARQVILTGFLDNPYPLMAQADLYVSLSLNEGISNSLLEAMYLGVPVLTSPAGGVMDFIIHGSNGLVVENFSREHVAEQLGHYYRANRNNKKQMAETGRKTVMEKFSLEKMVWSLENVLDAWQKTQNAGD